MTALAERKPNKTTGGSRLKAAGVAKRKKRTFRQKALEADFLHFCQLGAEADILCMTRSEFEELQQESAAFIHSADFTSARVESRIMDSGLLDMCVEEAGNAGRRKVTLPPHLSGLCEDALLTPAQERKLFQRMNYLRYLANRIISGLDHAKAEQWDIERCMGLLRAAQWYRDVIVRANMRLVISIVKKFANPQCGFDDLLSDGIMALIRSVDKFDYQLGFRFSTYATQVVRRNSYRFVMERQEERLKITNSLSESGVDIAEEVRDAKSDEARWSKLTQRLREMLDLLDKREKLIVRARFSLGSHRKVQTLQALADRLGISKERVRQLEKRALEKLQAIAEQDPVEVVKAS